MRLISLSMQNFRQHAASRIHFALGLTGIIGANGSGKSTILEGVSFALYGQPAARGKKESIKFLRAQPRATVRVELEFELAGHVYRVVRGLTSAECYLDGADTPIANTLTGVSDMLQRILGMTREEFFCTYFTGQKELAMMSSMGPTERGKFLSRVLGYDRIAEAQESVRARRSALVSELTGLKSGMPDGDTLSREIASATERLASAQLSVEKWRAEQSAKHAALLTLEPSWRDAQARNDATTKLMLDLQGAKSRLTMFDRDAYRLAVESGSVDLAVAEVATLRGVVAELPALRERAQAMDAQASAHATSLNLRGVEQTVQQSLDRLTIRLEELKASQPVDVVDATTRVAQLRKDVTAAETRYDDARDAWNRDLASAKADLVSLREQYEALKAKHDLLVSLGEDSPCATCGQRIGARFADVAAESTRAINELALRGTSAKAKVAGLSAAPANVTSAQTERGDVLASLQAAERALTQATTAHSERARVQSEYDAAATRLATVRQSLASMTATYDADAHAALRKQIDALAPSEARLHMLDAQIARGDALRAELATVQTEREIARREEETLTARLTVEGITPEAFASQRTIFQEASQSAQIAETALANAIAEATRAEESLGHHRASQERFAHLRERVVTMEHERFVLDETDRGYTDLRAKLNAQLRPELAEIASELLDTLTDGRYTQADIDESYNLQVMEDGLAKPVLSGGEEDLCNLILRLAISQMIAQRAGHAFSLLILDEVFGALDDARRANVMELLRRLNDRFAQVIVITHISQVRDGLDNILQVRYDAETGSSMIVSDAAEAMTESLQAAA